MLAPGKDYRDPISRSLFLHLFRKAYFSNISQGIFLQYFAKHISPLFREAYFFKNQEAWQNCQAS
jgi:hypothetical protein